MCALSAAIFFCEDEPAFVSTTAGIAEANHCHRSYAARANESLRHVTLHVILNDGALESWASLKGLGRDIDECRNWRHHATIEWLHDNIFVLVSSWKTTA